MSLGVCVRKRRRNRARSRTSRSRFERRRDNDFSKRSVGRRGGGRVIPRRTASSR